MDRYYGRTKRQWRMELAKYNSTESCRTDAKKKAAVTVMRYTSIIKDYNEMSNPTKITELTESLLGKLPRLTVVIVLAAQCAYRCNMSVEQVIHVWSNIPLYARLLDNVNENHEVVQSIKIR